jgi:uncharacterized RDD family membrane protein YckC
MSLLAILLCAGLTLRSVPAVAAPEISTPAIVSIAVGNDDSDSADKPDDWSRDIDRPARHHHHRDYHDREVVNLGHDSYLGPDEVAESVVSIFGSSNSEGDAGDVVSVFGNTRVTGPVGETAVAVFGNVYVDSHVDGDVVSVFGGVELGPHAEVDGNVVTVMGKLVRSPEAKVHGGTEHVFSGFGGDFDWLNTWFRECVLKGRLLAFAPGLGWVWGIAFVALAFYMLLAQIFQSGVRECARTLETNTGHAVLAALVAILLTPVLFVLLAITVIGIAAIPFVGFALLCMSVFGKVVILYWLGTRVMGQRAAASGVPAMVPVFVGGLIAMLLYVVPVLGFLIFKLLGFFGFGAVVYTLLLKQRARQSARADRYHAPPPGPGTGPGVGTAAGFTAAAAAAASATAAPADAPQPPGSGEGAATAAARAPSDPQASQALLSSLPRVGFLPRMVALLIDVVLIGMFIHFTEAIFWHHDEGSALFLPLAIYGALMWKLRGTTVGGIVMDHRVVRLDGRPIEWETAIVRALSCFLSALAVGLGFIWIAIDDDHQAWHDKIAGTVVVKVPKQLSYRGT